MPVGELLLTLLLSAVVLIILSTVVCAVLGSRRGRMEQWARNGFTVSLGVVILAGVLSGSYLAIDALNELSGQETYGAYATPSADYGSAAEATPIPSAAPIQTAPPGTIVTPTPAPEAISGMNYGTDVALTDCNDYVFVMEDAALYTGPGESYDEFGSVSAGATLSRSGYTADGWSLVDYNGNRCFISNGLLIVNE